MTKKAPDSLAIKKSSATGKKLENPLPSPGDL
jgi:hypothetical protein